MGIPSIRSPAVAGLFYPAEPAVLQGQVAELLARAATAAERVAPPKALIVPHAGYVYSGPIAATAFAQLEPLRARIRRVVLLGPAHRVPVRGLALPAAQAFRTPLGEVPLHLESWRMLRELETVEISDIAHAQEHCLEVQLPFLQLVLERFELVPLLVGGARPETVEAVIESLWGGDETLIVISSDLSHYHPYARANQLDRRTVDDILALHPTIQPEHACGAYPINGFLRVAAARGLKPHLLELRNSGDTAGDRSAVVGYTSIAFCEEKPGERPLRH